jgi:DNA-binding NarL/FixJ family response regulator
MPRPTDALIIDDEAHVVVLLAALLKQLGVKTVWGAPDGTTGLSEVEAHKPGVVLLDLNLPEVTGLEVLERLKKEHPDLPVIIVSAQNTVRTVARAKELGAEGFVFKYAPKSEVTQMLSEALDRIAGRADGKPADGDKPDAKA